MVMDAAMDMGEGVIHSVATSRTPSGEAAVGSLAPKKEQGPLASSGTT